MYGGFLAPDSVLLQVFSARFVAPKNVTHVCFIKSFQNMSFLKVVCSRNRDQKSEATSACKYGNRKLSEISLNTIKSQ